MSTQSKCQIVLELFSNDLLNDDDAIRHMAINGSTSIHDVDDLLSEVDRAGFKRPERHRPKKVKTELEEALNAAWEAVMAGPALPSGDQRQVGPYDHQVLFIGHVPGFLQQAETSLKHWLTSENLNWWIQAAWQLTYSANPAPGFLRYLEIEDTLKEMAHRIHGRKY